jgi:hypothetical protein
LPPGPDELTGEPAAITHDKEMRRAGITGFEPTLGADAPRDVFKRSRCASAGG